MPNAKKEEKEVNNLLGSKNSCNFGAIKIHFFRHEFWLLKSIEENAFRIIPIKYCNIKKLLCASGTDGAVILHAEKSTNSYSFPYFLGAAWWMKVPWWIDENVFLFSFCFALNPRSCHIWFDLVFSRSLAFAFVVVCVFFFFFFFCFFLQAKVTRKESQRTLVELLKVCVIRNGNYLQLFILNGKMWSAKMIFVCPRGTDSFEFNGVILCASATLFVRSPFVQSTFQWLLRITKKIRNLNWVCNPVLVSWLRIKRQIKRLKKTTNGKSPLQIKWNHDEKKEPTSNAKREKQPSKMFPFVCQFIKFVHLLCLSFH